LERNGHGHTSPRWPIVPAFAPILQPISAADASVLIETLRNILSGETDLDALLQDASTAAE
jgi:hypothetical protein